MTIQFENIKPHRGDRRWAFEELCFLLFATEFKPRGDAVRREGAGGDAGLEGYIHDGLGRVLLGVQAKYFVADTFKSNWWAQMADSVRTALASNASHAVMESYIICTPRTFTEEQQERWNDLCTEWTAYSLTLGYPIAPTFQHWGYSKLEELLLQPRMRGQLLYWFGYPYFDAERCEKLNSATIAGLHDRFMPGLHTPTDCEEQIHRFLRTERFWREFVEQTQKTVGKTRAGSWMRKEDWPSDLHPLVTAAKEALDRITQILGDGCHFPLVLRDLSNAGYAFDTSFYRLRDSAEEWLAQPAEADRQLGSENEAHLRGDINEFLGEISTLGGWAHWFEDLNHQPDAQFLLVLGPAGSGKTHTIAEIVTGFQKAGGRVLFVEGRFFTSDEEPWTQFLRWADFPGGVRDFLDCFSALATATSARAGGVIPPGIICIDALNETPERSIWLNRLESFAAELRVYPGLKLIVSCRDDFVDITLPSAVLEKSKLWRGEDKTEGWRAVRHYGLGAAVFDAAPRYLAKYRVRGADVLALAEEMENPLFLRTFCEAFQDAEVPPGARSLPAILRAYIARKAQNIQDRIGCAASQVIDALRDLARAMHTAGHKPMPQGEVRTLLQSRHIALDEARSLYRALCSEGFLHELRDRDVVGEIITVRFAYERVWDYMLTLHLLPTDHECVPFSGRRPFLTAWGWILRLLGAKKAAPLAELRDLLSDNAWCVTNQNLLGLLGIRLPEEMCCELHDFAASAPGANYAIDNAFLGSIRWRTRESFSARTEVLWNALQGRANLSPLFRLSLAPLVDHPWNADSLHNLLMRVPLAERDRGWTVALNEDFAWRAEDRIPTRLIALAESAAAHSVSDEQARLLGTALAWICSTTAVSYRHRAARALASVVQGRPLVAAALVGRFQEVNDPQIFESVLYGAAACAANSAPGTTGFDALVRIVHTSVFAGETVQPHILIRHYARAVCDQAHAKGALPTGITPESFQLPFQSEWPKGLSEADEASLKAEFDNDWKSKRALGSLLSSTRTEQMGGYGDWGRYEMGGRIHEFQRVRLIEAPAPEGSGAEFDDRIARRYVLGRVLALGLEKSSNDTPPDTGHYSRARPPIERIGKKYQWIAFYEFLGYLTDHYHYCEYAYSAARPFRSATAFELPDLLDSTLPPPKVRSTREGWDFTEAHPWWMAVPEPFPWVLGEAERNTILASPETTNPSALLRPGGTEGNWIALTGAWDWREPVPCWEEDGSYGYAHAGLEWFASSYAVPASALDAFVAQMRLPVVGGTMKENRPELREEIGVLVSFPQDSAELEQQCFETSSNVQEAWFTAVNYSTKSESGDFRGGVIPSPQLAKLMDLRWSHDGLDFVSGNSSDRAFQSVRQGNHRVTMIDGPLLTRASTKAGLRICWRLYGWKWSRGGHSNHAPVREYWVVYTLGDNGLPILVGGGTLLAGFRAVEEPLPW